MDAIEERKALVKSRKIAIPPGVDIGEWFFTDGQGGLRVEKPKDGGTVSTLIDEYLTCRQLEVESNQLSHSSYMSDKYRLAAFRKFCDLKKVADTNTALGANHLDAYRTSVMSKLAKRKIAAVSAKHALRTVKAMLLWAYDKEKLDALPRILNKYAEVTIPDPAPQFFSVEEVKRLYVAADDRLKLYILLGLNCGYTQADIASLEHAHIDWDRGMIVRARNKTGQPQEHKLWPVTLALLKQFATDPNNSSAVLLSEVGNPLMRVTIKEDGTPSKTDAIGHSFTWFKDTVNAERKENEPEITLPFKCFRKTGADQIAKHYQDTPILVDLYLAHVSGGMRKHYARQYFDKLCEATDWLGSVFGFNETRSSAGGNP